MRIVGIDCPCAERAPESVTAGMQAGRFRPASMIGTTRSSMSLVTTHVCRACAATSRIRSPLPGSTISAIVFCFVMSVPRCGYPVDTVSRVPVNRDDTRAIASRIAIGLRSTGVHHTRPAPMKKSMSLRVAVIASAVAVYSVYMHIDQLISGCMWVRGRQRCSFENSANFEGWMNLDLLVTCCWVAAAVVGWISVVQVTKKPE